MYAMLAEVTLSIKNNDVLLLSWGNQIPVDAVDFHAGYSQYIRDSLAKTVRDILEDTFKWVITDGGAAVIAP